MKNYLYVLGNEVGHVKIGVTNNPDINKRIKSLQTGNSYKIDVLYFEERYDAQKAERYLHREFHKNRMTGEWFNGISLKDIRIKLLLFFDQA